MKEKHPMPTCVPMNSVGKRDEALEFLVSTIRKDSLKRKKSGHKKWRVRKGDTMCRTWMKTRPNQKSAIENMLATYYKSGVRAILIWIMEKNCWKKILLKNRIESWMWKKVRVSAKEKNNISSVSQCYEMDASRQCNHRKTHKERKRASERAKKWDGCHECEGIDGNVDGNKNHL